MLGTVLKLLMVVGSALILVPDGTTGVALADSAHGVRVHRLIPAGSQPEKPKTVDHAKNHDVTPHRHRIVLRKGQRVIVRFADVIGRSRYRKRHPGIVRPWQERRVGRRSRLFMNPSGLYTSKIYRRGYY